MSAAERIGFGNVIRGVRRKQGWSQAKLGAKFGISFGHRPRRGEQRCHDHHRGGDRVGAGLKRELEGDS